jgi:hypothetical protein
MVEGTAHTRDDSWSSWQAELFARQLATSALSSVRRRRRLHRTSRIAWGATVAGPLVLGGLLGGLVGATAGGGAGLTAGLVVGLVSALVSAGVAIWATVQVRRVKTCGQVGFQDRLHLPVHIAQVGKYRVAADLSGVLAPPRTIAPPIVPNGSGLSALMLELADACQALPPLLEMDEAYDVQLSDQTADGFATLVGLEAKLAELIDQVTLGLTAIETPQYRPQALAKGDPALAVVREHAHRFSMPGELRLETNAAEAIVREVGATLGSVSEGQVPGGAATVVRTAHQLLSTLNEQFDIARSGSFQSAIFDQLGSLERCGSLSAFNFYCPRCNGEVLARVRERSYDHAAEGVDERLVLNREARTTLDPDRGLWTCKLCKTVTRHPIPVHRALDEALLPAYDALLRQHHTHRIRVYSDIHDQKLRYRQDAEHQLDELRRANRSEVDQTMEKLRDLVADLGESEAALQKYSQLIRGYSSLQKGRLADIASRADDFQADIEQRHAEWSSSFRAEVRSELARFNSSIEQHAQLAHQEQQLRDETMRRVADGMEELNTTQREALDVSKKNLTANEKAAAVSATWAREMGWDKPPVYQPVERLKHNIEGGMVDLGLKKGVSVGKEQTY